MTTIDRGGGPPLVLIPGMQGRWEYMRPAIDALSESCRVLTFPLCGERGCGARFEPALGLDNYAEQVLAALNHAGVERAAICGVSFGGLVAIRFAASHPERTSALVVVSTPGPGHRLRRRHVAYARAPWLLGPLFVAESPFRLRAELVAAFPHGAAQWRFARWQLRTLITAPLSLARMARRAWIMTEVNMLDECACISAPTLVVTGQRDLDHVVAVAETAEYARLIPGARAAILERTGHLGSITRPHEFARLVGDFLASSDRESLRQNLAPAAQVSRGGAPRASNADVA